MAEDNVFNADPVNDDVTVDILVGEGKKYRDTNNLAKGYVNLEGHLMELRRDLAVKEAEVELLKANSHNRPNDNLDTGNPPANTPAGVDPNNPTPTVVNDEDFRNRLRKEVESLDKERQATLNAELAAQKLVEHFGDAAKANEAVRRRAAELGVSVDWLKDAAARSPEALFASMGINTGQPVSRQTPAPHNDVRFERQNMSGEKKYSDFEELRRTNKSKYYSAENQREMQAQAKKLGTAFYL